VEHPVGEAAHLRMIALAGVSAHGIGQGDYLFEGLEVQLDMSR
jgi:hypothetical protein